MNDILKGAMKKQIHSYSQTPDISNFLNSPIFPIEELSPETFVKLPKHPHAESKSVKLYIVLAEPHLFLEGFSKEEISSRPPSILRGCLFLRILQPVKIKEINLRLKGKSRTEWPEGIPPKKTENFELKSIIDHTWPFFNHLNHYPVSETQRNNADLFIPRNDSDVSNFSLDGNLTPVTSNDIRPIRSPVSAIFSNLMSTKSQTSSLSNIKHALESDLITSSSTSASDSNKLFIPGDYIYSFELPIRSSIPETVNVTFGSINYSLEAHLERSGTFKTSLVARRALNIIRSPFEFSSEENEPIIIDKDWENRLQYDIVISSKQVILNSYLPISFRLIPLEKIKIHRLRVYVTEHLDYYCHNKKVHRTEPPKKILLLEHKPTEPSDNLLALNNDEIGGVELDFQVFIPEYYNEVLHLHPDTTTEDIQSHHWIKICVRISKSEPTEENPEKRKQYELSIDSPIHLLSSHCVHANTLLPSYDEQMKIDNQSNETLILNHNSDSNLGSRQSFDKMMSPRSDTILDSNLFKPKSSVPIEMLSQQAKPFSPIASPELNAMSPELRNNPTLRSLNELSPIISPVSGNMRSNSKTSMKHLKNTINSRPVAIRQPSSNSFKDLPPPPPFVENPPKYEDAMKNVTKNQSSASSRNSISNSTHSNGSSGNLTESSSNASTMSALASSAITHSNSTNSIPTRISLNLASSMNNSSSAIQLPRINANAGNISSSTSNPYTPSISSFLNLSSTTDQSNAASKDTEEKKNRDEFPIRGRLNTNASSVREEFDLASHSHSNLQFKITPVRSASNSPTLNPATQERAVSPIRSRSPLSYLANDRNLNKLVNSTFTPGFTLEKESNGSDAAMAKSPPTPPSPRKTKKVIADLISDSDEIIEEAHPVTSDHLATDETFDFTDVQKALLKRYSADFDEDDADEDVNFSRLTMNETLDNLSIINNRSTTTLSTLPPDISLGSLRNPSITSDAVNLSNINNLVKANDHALNFMGNKIYFDEGKDLGEDVSTATHTSQLKRLKNPNLIHESN